MLAELKETRFAKLSFAGVVGFDVEVDVDAFNGVVLPDMAGVGRRLAKVYEAFGTAGFLVSGLVVQSRPERSFIVCFLAAVQQGLFYNIVKRCSDRSYGTANQV